MFQIRFCCFSNVTFAVLNFRRSLYLNFRSLFLIAFAEFELTFAVELLFIVLMICDGRLLILM